MTDPLQSLTGDAAGAAVLRRSLERLAELEDGTPLGYRVREVLAGERDVRALAEDPRFDELTRQGMAAFAEEWAGLGPAERERELRAGEELLAGLDDGGTVRS